MNGRTADGYPGWNRTCTGRLRYLVAINFYDDTNAPRSMNATRREMRAMQSVINPFHAKCRHKQQMILRRISKHSSSVTAILRL